MTAPRHALRQDCLVWTGAVAVAVLAHVAVAAAVLLPSQEASVDADAVSAAMVVELAPVEMARADAPHDLPAGPDQVQGAAAQASPSETPPDQKTEPPDTTPPAETPKIETPLTPPSEVALPEPQRQPPPQPAPSATTSAGADTTSATRIEAPRVAEKAAATTVGGTSKIDPRIIANWNGKLAAALEKNKRYPADARAHHQEGIVEVRFRIDRDGHLLAREITRTSNQPALDAEALALLERAEPFPLPPVAVPGSDFTFVVPIRFAIR